jgi:hypothetical protein
VRTRFESFQRLAKNFSLQDWNGESYQSNPRSGSEPIIGRVAVTKSGTSVPAARIDGPRVRALSPILQYADRGIPPWPQQQRRGEDGTPMPIRSLRKCYGLFATRKVICRLSLDGRRLELEDPRDAPQSVSSRRQRAALGHEPRKSCRQVRCTCRQVVPGL